MRKVWPTLIVLALVGCGTAPVREDDHSLVIAACPELAPVDLVTPADSYRLHVEDAARYNECRCAALRNTKLACKKAPPAR